MTEAGDQRKDAQQERGGLLAKVLGTYERQLVFLLLLVYVLTFADPALVGALGPTLKSVFAISNTLIGLLVSAVSVISGLATIPFGMLADRTKRVRLLAISLLLWTVAEGLTGAAFVFAMLIIVRVFLGIIGAASGPTIPSLVGDLVPARERGRTFGTIITGQILGVALGYVLPVLVLAFASWRATFWVLAVFGLGLSIAFWRVREPPRTGAAGPGGHAQGDHRSSQVRELVQRRGVEPSRRAVLREPAAELSLWQAAVYVWNVRTDVFALVSRAIGDYFFLAIGTFAVIFATHWYGLTMRQADLVFLVVGIGALAGVLALGWLGDTLLRRERLNSRLWVGGVAYLLAPFALFPAFSSHSLVLSLPLYAVGAFLLVGAFSPTDAVRIDVIVPRLRGRAEAIRQVLRTIAEGAAPAVVGFLSDHLLGGGTRGLYAALVVTLPALFLSGAILLLAVRTYPHDVAAAIASEQQGRETAEEEHPVRA